MELYGIVWDFLDYVETHDGMGVPCVIRCDSALADRARDVIDKVIEDLPDEDNDRYTPSMPSGPLKPPVVQLLGLVNADGRPLGVIAAAAGMSAAQFSQVLTGYRADPSITTVGRILTALGKTWADLDPPPVKGRRPKARPAP